MSYTNNKNRLVNTKMTSIGRAKIATGNLKLASWSIGDSEINYVREDYLVDNNITNNPSRILRAVDQQPDLKYFLVNQDGVHQNPLKKTDISVTKLYLRNNASERGVFKKGTLEFDSKLIKYSENLPKDSASSVTITIVGFTPKIGDIIYFEVPVNTTEGVIIEKYYRNIKSILGNIFTLNRPLPEINNNFDIYVISGDAVETVPMWNVAPNYKWNGDVMDYEVASGDIGTKVWDFNIVVLEEILGYYSPESTKGQPFLGLIENYLGYNDSMNLSNLNDIDNCGSNELNDGGLDDFQKMVGVIHYSNPNLTNIYGDAFYLDHLKGIKFELTLQGIKSHKYPTDTIISSTGALKYFPDSDIEYYDIEQKGTEIILGKVLPQYKMVLIEDEELLMCMSIGSGRTHTLPMIQTTLDISSDGILPSGKQMFITYSTNNNSHEKIGHSVPCVDYNKIVNTSTSPKDVKISFNKDDLNLFLGKRNLAIVGNLEVMYQITDIGERPKSNNWKSINVGRLIGMDGELSSNNTEKLMELDFKIDKSIISSDFDLRQWYLKSNQIGLIGDENVLLGNINTAITSIVYKSIITLNINPNVFVKTNNPTYKDVSGVSPFFTMSEIGIYDEDDDLVMIGKLTRPINLSTNSTIRIEIGLDF